MITSERATDVVPPRSATGHDVETRMQRSLDHRRGGIGMAMQIWIRTSRSTCCGSHIVLL